MVQLLFVVMFLFFILIILRAIKYSIMRFQHFKFSNSFCPFFFFVYNKYMYRLFNNIKPQYMFCYG